MDKQGWNRWPNVVCLLSLLIDSGGGLGLRNLSFVIIVLTVLNISADFKLNKLFLVFYSLFTVTLIPALCISLFINSLPAKQVLVWIVSFLLVPLFYVYVKISKLNTQDFVMAGAIFSCIILILFVGRLTNISIIVNVNDYITSHSDGFFGDKSFTSGDILPNVYFQGTLGLVICGALSLEVRRYFSFTLILIALIVAPSRFGFAMLVAWAFFLFLRKSPRRILVVPVLMVVGYWILSFLPFGKELFSIVNGESDGLGIRGAHFQSMIQSYAGNVASFFWGQGPGSVFYTTGFSSYTDNIEMSQVEYVRKYGIISFLAFNIFFFGPMLGRGRSAIFIRGTLLIYYIVALSNPVLYSIFAMLFLCFAYVKQLDEKNEQPLEIYKPELNEK